MTGRACIPVVVALVVFQGGPGRAQSFDLPTAFGLPPIAARTVTVSKGGTLLASFNVPKGGLLRVSSDKPSKFIASAGRGRWELHGNVVLRIQPASAEAQADKTMEQIMSEAPLVLTAQDADVVIEKSN